MGLNTTKNGKLDERSDGLTENAKHSDDKYDKGNEMNAGSGGLTSSRHTKMRKTLLAAVAVLACVSQAEAQKVSIPLEGTFCATDITYPRPNMSSWEVTYDKCVAEDKTLRITKSDVEWIESFCYATKVQTLPKRDAWEDYKLNLKCEGEGDRWSEIVTFSLYKGKILVIETNSETKRRPVKYRERK